MSLLDLLFPKQCVSCRKYGSYVCANCFAQITFLDTSTCASCQRPAIGGLTHPVCHTTQMIEGVFSSVVYNGVVKRLVYRFKYKPYIRDVQETISTLFYEGLIQQEAFFRLLKEQAVFVPIPLHAVRFRMRGYNQSLLLATGLSKRFGLPVVELLSRTRNTPTQVGQSQAEREKNIKDAFALKKPLALEKEKTVFLVDDVYTSGAALKEAAKVLKREGVANVYGVTFAHGK